MRKFIALALLIFAASVFADLGVSTASGDQTNPDCAGMGGKSFVAWTDSRVGTSNLHIYGNMVDTDGTLTGTVPICVATNNQYDVAASEGARFVTAWVDERSAGNWALYGHQINLDGTIPATGEFLIFSSDKEKSKTCADNLGNDVMVVFEESQDSIRRIRGHRLTWDGSDYGPSGSDFDISADYDASDPDICAGGDDYLVAWIDTTNRAVISQRIDATGSTIGDTTVVAFFGGGFKPGHPAIAWDGSQWLVVWDIYVVGTQVNVYGRFVDDAGNISGSIINVAELSGDESYPEVSFDGVGYNIVWQDTRGGTYAYIYSRRLVAGSLQPDTGITEQINNENNVVVCWNGSHHDVFWQDRRSVSTWDIYSTRQDITPWAGPSATPTEPLDMGGSSCIRQDAKMTISDSDGINGSTIEFDAAGTIYTTSDPELSFSGGNLTYSPSSDWPEDTWIECCLNHAEDMTGLDLAEAVCWQFMIDLTDPVFGASNPADGDTVGAGAVPISIAVSDAGIGVSTDSMGFSVEGTWYYHGSSPAVSWDGSEMQFDPSAEGIAFDPFDTIDVCAKVSDGAKYCAPNEIQTCWSFMTVGSKIYGWVDLGGETDDSGATVEATYGDSTWTDVTDAGGNYSIPGVMEVAGITVTAYKSGFTDSTVTVDMSAGGMGETNFTLYPIMELFFSDFESDDGGLTTYSYDYYQDWEWGEPTDGPGSAHSGTKCWATQLNQDYHDSSQSRLVLGPINLPTSSGPKLSWWQWYRFQPPTYYYGTYSWHDGGNVKLWTSLTDSVLLTPNPDYDTTMTEWNNLVPYQRAYADEDIGDYWHRASVDLTPWEGEEIYISWDFGSSSRNVESGWFIDDVLIGYIEVTAAEEKAPRPETDKIEVSPNPFNATCKISVSGDIEILDVTGRVVSRQSISGEAVWKGTSDAGRELPSGVYFIRKVDSEKPATRVILLR